LESSNIGPAARVKDRCSAPNNIYFYILIKCFTSA
jgi:hypothetical protein